MESVFRFMKQDQDVVTNWITWVNTPVIVEAGPSGLALDACLREQNVHFVVLDREDCLASLWRQRTYDRLKLHLPKQFCQVPKMPFPEIFPEYPTKRQFINYLESYVSRFQINPKFNECVQTVRSNEASGLWQIKALGESGYRTKVEYIFRWLVVGSGENAERVMPENGLTELTRQIVSETNPMGYYEAAEGKKGPSLTQTTYYVNWKGTQALDSVLNQQTAQVCYAIAMTRQLGDLLRLKGLLEPHESLSIQYVINEARRLLLNPVGHRWDGSIHQLEMLTPLFIQKGIVLEGVVPLTYSLELTNRVFDERVRRFKATKLVNHYLGSYADDDTFENSLSSFLMVSPVTVVVPSYESFWRTVRSEIYYPTEADLSNTRRCYHAMLLTGAGYDEKGNQFWEVQDSAGEWRGDRGFVRIAKGRGFIRQFVEMSL